MIQTLIAMCVHCGAALRIAKESSGTAVCQYCGVTSIIGHVAGAPANAPKLRIDPPPPIFVNTFGAVLMGGLFLCAGFGLIALATSVTGLASAGMAVLGALFCWLMFAVAARTWLKERRYKADQEWLRANGLPSRATVERIHAGQDHSATLGLKVELIGSAALHVEHYTTIPPLLVPRLVEGLTLPVVVDPEDHTCIEVQWHLV